MNYFKIYTHTPVGNLLFTADEIGLTGVWFEGSRSDELLKKEGYVEEEQEIFKDTSKWFDNYFSGKRMEVTLPVHLIGSEFQKQVWKKLMEIPYGELVTYGELAKEIAKERGISRMSAQAVGGAVGKNPISILIPCHRVIGAKGNLTGYGGGLERKIVLLKLERAFTKYSNLFDRIGKINELETRGL